MTPEAADAFRTELADYGEEIVRRNLGRGVWSAAKRRVAEDWLEDREKAKVARFGRGDRIRSWIAIAIAALSLAVAVAAMFLGR